MAVKVVVSIVVVKVAAQVVEVVVITAEAVPATVTLVVTHPKAMTAFPFK
jgi:hypothetical protein